MPMGRLRRCSNSECSISCSSRVAHRHPSSARRCKGEQPHRVYPHLLDPLSNPHNNPETCHPLRNLAQVYKTARSTTVNHSQPRINSSVSLRNNSNFSRPSELR